jgi:hypothetical protein
MKTLTTTQSATGRLTMYQVRVQTDENLGRLFADKSFPKISRGTFDEAAVLAWIKTRDSQRSNPTATSPVPAPNTPRDRRTTTDRRTPRV